MIHSIIITSKKTGKGIFAKPQGIKSGTSPMELYVQTAAIACISTSAPFAKAATPTVALAGKCSSK
jgi:hypothetical protein